MIMYQIISNISNFVYNDAVMSSYFFNVGGNIMDELNHEDINRQEQPNEPEQPNMPFQHNQTNYREPSYNTSFQFQPAPLPLKSLKGWSAFQAVLEIIQGALLCLGIITAIIGVPKIIAGVKLLNAGDDIQAHMQTGDPRKMDSSINNITSYFKLNGISNIISICLNILTILFLIIFIGFIISRIPEWIHEFNFQMDL